MTKKQKIFTMGSKFGCLTIIGDINSNPKYFKDFLVKLNLKNQINIMQKNINGDFQKDYNDNKYYICRCQCGREYWLSEEYLLNNRKRYCGDDCFSDIVYDKTENFDVDYTNTSHESLSILECIGEGQESLSWIEKTRSKRIKHIKIYKKYRCRCYLCGKEYVFKSTDFKINNDSYGTNASKGYYSNAQCNCHKISSFQWRTIDIFNKYNIDYKVEVSFPDLIGSIGHLKYDFAILDKNGSIKYLVECQGEQHYKPVEKFGGAETFKYQLEKDGLKRRYTVEHNIPFIEIPYTCNTYEKEEKFLQEYKIF